MELDLPAIEERARSIIMACKSPGACDVASINNFDGFVSVRLADERIDLEPDDPRCPTQVAYLKSRVAAVTRARRANAMLDAVASSSDRAPLWTIATHHPIAEWIAWAGVGPELARHTRWMEDQGSRPSIADRVSIDAEVDGRKMALRASIYGGVLTGSVTLRDKPLCYFTGRPHPRIVVEATTVPEHLILEIEMRLSNGSVHLSDIISHPFLATYDPPVSGTANSTDTFEITLDCDLVTLEPVPLQAMRAVPPDADPARPWEPTPDERALLRGL